MKHLQGNSVSELISLHSAIQAFRVRLNNAPKDTWLLIQLAADFGFLHLILALQEWESKGCGLMMVSTQISKKGVGGQERRFWAGRGCSCRNEAKGSVEMLGNCVFQEYWPSAEKICRLLVNQPKRVTMWAAVGKVIGVSCSIPLVHNFYHCISQRPNIELQDRMFVLLGFYPALAWHFFLSHYSSIKECKLLTCTTVLWDYVLCFWSVCLVSQKKLT